MEWLRAERERCKVQLEKMKKSFSEPRKLLIDSNFFIPYFSISTTLQCRQQARQPLLSWNSRTATKWSNGGVLAEIFFFFFFFYAVCGLPRNTGTTQKKCLANFVNENYLWWISAHLLRFGDEMLFQGCVMHLMLLQYYGMCFSLHGESQGRLNCVSC